MYQHYAVSSSLHVLLLTDFMDFMTTFGPNLLIVFFLFRFLILPFYFYIHLYSPYNMVAQATQEQEYDK